MMHTNIADQNSVLGQGLVNFNSGTLRVDRGAVIDHARGDKCVPFGAVAIDGMQPFAAFCGRAATVTAPVKLGDDLAQKCPHISH